MKFSEQDLLENSLLYKANMKRLIETVGTPEHDIYVKRERELNSFNSKIKEEIPPLEPLLPSEKVSSFAIRRELCKDGFTQKLLKIAGL